MNQLNLSGVRTETWVVTISLVLSLVNTVLRLFGLDVLPFSEEEVATAVSAVWVVISAVIAWWENNSFTRKAQEADKELY